MSVENRENRPPSRSAYPPGVKFEVQFADKKLNIAAPKRIVDLENSTRRDLSQELIDEKQRKAEERRKVRKIISSLLSKCKTVPFPKHRRRSKLDLRGYTRRRQRSNASVMLRHPSLADFQRRI